MRLPELIFVLCLLFSACIGSSTVARKSFLISNLFDGAIAKKNNTCETHDDAYYKSNTTSDDKRVVPTGPNPLHNSKTYVIDDSIFLVPSSSFCHSMSM